MREGGRRSEWIVAREFCLFAVLDCAGVPLKKRAGFVAIAARRMAPFSDAEHHAVFAGNSAMLWIWPRALLQNGIEPPYARDEGDLVLPESLYRGAPAEDGVELVACSAGFEARYWKSGVLASSRWWPEAPTSAEWLGFARGAGLGECAMPQPLPASELAATPWSAPSGIRFDSRRWQQAGVPALWLGACLMAAWYAYSLSSWVQSTLQTASIRRQIAELDSQLSAVLDARQNAQQDRQRIGQLLHLRTPIAQLRLMAEVDRLLGDKAAQLSEWEVRGRDQLRFTVVAGGSNPQALVESLQGSGFLYDVSASPGRESNQLTLQARVSAPGRLP